MCQSERQATSHSRQWLLLRGRDHTNPVLLFVQSRNHGAGAPVVNTVLFGDTLARVPVVFR